MKGTIRLLSRSAIATALGLLLLLWLPLPAERILGVWLRYLFWLVPVVITALLFRRAWRDESYRLSRMVLVTPTIILAVFMVIDLYSGTALDHWFYMNRWFPSSIEPFDALMPRFVLATACLTPFFAFRRRWLWVVLLVALVLLQISCFHSLWVATQGQPIYRDDHPSFLFRLYEFRENFPSLVNYNPFWNAGTIHYVGTTSGVYSIGLLLWPLWAFADIDAVYTLGIGLVFILFVPFLAAASVRMIRGNATACWSAGLMALGVCQMFFLWMLHYGTVGAATASAFILPVSACVYRVVWLNRRDGWLAAVLIVSTLFLLLWPPGAIMCFPIALALVVSGTSWSTKRWVFLGVCGAAVLLLFLKPLLVILGQGNFVLSYIFDPSRPAQSDSTHLLTTSLLAEGWHLFLADIKQGHPVLVFLGLAGCLVLPQRSLRRWFLPILLGFALLAGWGEYIEPDLQLKRMAIPLFFVAIAPASILVGRLLGTANPLLAPVRAAVVAMLVVGGYSVSLTYRNEGPARYKVIQQLTIDLTEWIKTETPEHSRILFTGKTVHAYGRGHIAYLPILTGREMMACDYYHFPPKYVEYNYPPPPFRKDREKFLRFMELHNVSHLVTYHENWKEFIRTFPDDFEEVAAFDYVSVFRAREVPGMLLGSSGTAEADFNVIRVALETPGEEAVVKYNWDDRLRADGPAEVFPYDAGDGITLTGIRPNGETNIVIRYRNGL